jgi:hypothetical protein
MDTYSAGTAFGGASGTVCSQGARCCGKAEPSDRGVAAVGGAYSRMRAVRSKSGAILSSSCLHVAGNSMGRTGFGMRIGLAMVV